MKIRHISRMIRPRRTPRILTASLLPLAVILSLLSCSNEDILAPTTATLSLVVNPSSMPADGQSTAEIEAILQDESGSAIHGVTIYFSTTLGTITEKAKTEDGIARVVLTAGTIEGTATIRAFSGSLSDTAQLVLGFENLTILMTANPFEIPADGVSTSRIDALVTDDRGIAPDGTLALFTTDLGTIDAQATTVGGRATATLTAGLIEGTATITAVVSNVSQTTTMSVGIPVSNITLDASPSTIEVSDAQTQTHTVDIVATVWNAAGVTIENKSVVLTTDLGTLDSQGAVQRTDANGQVTDRLEVTVAVPQGTSELVRVTATSGSISATTTITIINQG